MITIKNFDINVLANEDLLVKDVRKAFGNDSVVNELKLVDEVTNTTYYFILNHLDIGPKQVYLLEESIFNRLKRIGQYTAQDFIDFINEKYLPIDLDDYDFEELEEMPFGKAMLTILVVNDYDDDILKEIKGKKLKDVVIPDDFAL